MLFVKLDLAQFMVNIKYIEIALNINLQLLLVYKAIYPNFIISSACQLRYVFLLKMAAYVHLNLNQSKCFAFKSSQKLHSCIFLKVCYIHIHA